VGLVLALSLVGCGEVESFEDLWWTRDQQGQRAYERGEPAQAAALFRDPLWRGRAQYEAGDYEAAAATLDTIPTAEAAFDRGCALSRLERWEEARDSFARALELQPGWTEAEENWRLADFLIARPPAAPEGDPGDPRLEADEVVEDERGERGERGEVDASQEVLAEMWMRRLDADPAEFLRRKFAVQAAGREEPR
jgi:Ca-activated chloride channel homolog